MRKIVVLLKRKIYNFCNKIFRKFYFVNTVTRNITNIFDYYKVIDSRPDADEIVIGSSRYYGLNHVLKSYSGYTGVIWAVSEHAPGLDVLLGGGEYKDLSEFPLLVVSKQRRDFLRDYTNRIIFPLGPSISYANNIYNQFDLEIIKKALGKTLVIYPMHDIEDFHYIDEANGLIGYIREIQQKYNYDTVLVSMYFVDIERGRHLRYEHEGWHIVSAGRRENYDFNNCMKTIISLADHVIVEGITSAIGYCVYMGIPVTVFHKSMDFVEKNVEGIQDDMGVPKHTIEKFESMFAEFTEDISKEQYDFCNYWYGYDDVLSNSHLKLLFMYIAEIRGKTDPEYFKKIASKDQYFQIKDYLLENIDKYEQTISNK